MWVLQLNDMRSPQVEIMTPICRSETKEALLNFLKQEGVEAYIDDDRWHKQYRKGGPLEWFNPPTFDNESFIDVATEDDWAVRARERFRNQIMILPYQQGF